MSSKPTCPAGIADRPRRIAMLHATDRLATPTRQRPSVLTRGISAAGAYRSSAELSGCLSAASRQNGPPNRGQLSFSPPPILQPSLQNVPAKPWRRASPVPRFEGTHLRVSSAVFCTREAELVVSPTTHGPIEPTPQLEPFLMHQMQLARQIATEVSLTYMIFPRNSRACPARLQSLRPSIESACRNEQSP